MVYFVGDFPEDVQYYSTAPTIAGTNHVFTAPSRACDNCGKQAEAGLRVSDTTPITPILLDYVTNGTLSSLHPIDVVPFLKTNLHWRTVGVSGAAQALFILLFSLSYVNFQAYMTISCFCSLPNRIFILMCSRPITRSQRPQTRFPVSKSLSARQSPIFTLRSPCRILSLRKITQKLLLGGPVG